jgi:hypothetical protein
VPDAPTHESLKTAAERAHALESLSAPVAEGVER